MENNELFSDAAANLSDALASLEMEEKAVKEHLAMIRKQRLTVQKALALLNGKPLRKAKKREIKHISIDEQYVANVVKEIES